MKNNKMVLKNSAIVKQIRKSIEGLSSDMVLTAYNGLLETLEKGKYPMWSKEYKLAQKAVYEDVLGWK